MTSAMTTVHAIYSKQVLLCQVTACTCKLQMYQHTCSFTVCFSVSISSSALALSAFSLCVSVATSYTVVQTIGKNSKLTIHEYWQQM